MKVKSSEKIDNGYVLSTEEGYEVVCQVVPNLGGFYWKVTTDWYEQVEEFVETGGLTENETSIGSLISLISLLKQVEIQWDGS